jgi:hypothetical protein
MNDALYSCLTLSGLLKLRCYCFLFIFNSFGVGKITLLLLCLYSILLEFYVNSLFKKIWVMDRVTNFWKVGSNLHKNIQRTFFLKSNYL